MAHILRYFYFATHHVFGLYGGFASRTPLPLVPVFPFPVYAFHMRPHSSVYMWYRNLNLLSIGYVFRPLLRPRLTLIWARIAAVFANKATPKTLNRATGVILVILGLVVMLF